MRATSTQPLQIRLLFFEVPMVKQKKTTDFNMAREIRELIAKEPQMTGREVAAALKKKFPRQKINANSCGVAFSNARKKLGLR
jgi:hypothetical protein